MMIRILALGGISIGIALAQSASPAAAQGYQPTASPKGFTPPKTPWGEPDLQGIWPLNHLIAVPLERPKQYGNRLYLTDEEFAKAQGSIETRNKRLNGGPIPAADSPDRPMRQTSLIIDPPDGRFPPLTENGKKLQAEMKSSYRPGQTVFDEVADFAAWDRCITRGLPVSMEPRNYNNGIRIMQSPGYVLIVLEMAHEVRIIPTDGRPALDPSIKEWMGESRGRWEGNTLVVETTNFNGKTDMTNAGVPGSPPINPTTENLRITERFTRTDNDTIEYQMKVQDPDVVVSPWAVEFPLKLDNKYQMFEYACHEGNTAIRGYIETSRFERTHKTAK